MNDDRLRAGLRGRGAASNSPSRFERLELEPEAGEAPGPARTEFLRDASRSVISYNDSPDVGFDASLNPYRGCEHGCSYCYARPTHEYLGFSAGLDFETRILVKRDAPSLLRRELSLPRWKPQVLGLSGVTDPYQPIERRLEITRGCLDVLRELRNPVAVVTKNHLVTRDIDHLAELARYGAAGVFVSITSLDGALHGVMEPRTSHPARRVAAIRELSRAGIPTGVLIGPVIPGLNDHEIPAIVEAAAEAGAEAASYIMLRLPLVVAPLFEEWLERHYPDRKDKVLNRIRSLRGGRLNEATYGVRMRGRGAIAEQVRTLFDASVRRSGMRPRRFDLSAEHFKSPGGRQLGLFG